MDLTPSGIASIIDRIPTHDCYDKENALVPFIYPQV